MATIDDIVKQVISTLQEQSRNTEALPQEGNAGSVGSFVALKKADNLMVQVPISVIETMINEKFDTLLNGTDPNEIDSITDLVNWVSEHGAEASEMVSAIQANTDAIDDETTRATAAEKALSERIDNIPTGGGTGEIADGSVTEQKLSFDVAEKLNTAYDKANLANNLFINDGIEIYKGALRENSDPYTGTSYEMYSNKILANGENVVLAEDFKFTSYKLFNGDEEARYSALSGNELILENKGYIYQLGIARSNNGSVSFTDFSTVIKSFIRKPYTWDDNSNLNNFTPQGRYTIRGERQANAQDNMPILNGGKIEARLEVIENENTLVQILTLLNVGGGDGNIYTRTRQDNTWGAWGKLQTNIEVGLIGVGQLKTFDDFTDNGMYSGVNAYWTDAVNYITSVETFVLVVINAYLYGGGVAQLKYSTLLDGTATVKIRTRVDGSWGEWQSVGGGGSSYTLPVATTDVLGGVKSAKGRGYIGESPAGREYALTVDGVGFAFVTIPVAEEVDADNNEPVSGKAVANYVTDAVDTPVVNQTATTATIAPNVMNVWGEVTQLDITLGESKVGVINEYMFQFTSGATATTLVLPADIKWVSVPNIQANKTYQVSIINNLGVIGEFSDE